MEQEERWNVYIPDEDVTVNVPKTWGYDRIMSEYSKERENVLKVNREQLNKERFEKLAGFDYSKDYFNKIQLNLAEKKIGEETNPLLTFGKSAINQISDLTIGSLSKGAGMVGDVTAGIVGTYKARELSPKQREKFLKDVDEAGKEIVEKGKDIAENMQFNIRQGESEVAQGLGSILTSYGLMGLTGAYGVFGKGMKASEALRKGLPVAGLFGVGSGLSMYEKVRAQGGQIPEALGKGTAAGAGETLLEEVGIYGLLKGTRAKLFKKFPWAGYIVSAGGTGAVQETSQTLKDIAIAGERDVREADEKLNELIDSAIYGTIGEIFGGVVSSVSHKDMRNKIRNQAIVAGYDEQTANVIAWEATENPQGVTQSFLDTMKDGLKTLTDEDIKRGQEYVENALNNGGSEADFYLDIKDPLKERMLKAGFSEEKAESESTFWATRDISLYLALQDIGANISKADFLKERSQKIENFPEVEVKVDKQGRITPESEELLEEARERVAIMEENGATPEEIQAELENMGVEGGRLFSFVGEKANLPKKTRTSLDEAKSLEQDGLLNNEQIRQTTGWSKGIDGQWKLELSDKDARINIENITKQGLKLGDILSHDILYGAYPKLKDIPVVYNPNISAIASVRKKYSEIVLGRRFKNETDTEQRKTIMHEVQHLIQGKEGFAVGGSTGNFRSPKTTFNEKMDLWRRSHIAETLLDSLDLKSTAPVSTARRLMSEIKEKAKHSEFLQDRIKKFEELEEQFKEYDQKTSYAKYSKLGGELEANLTAERIDLTDEERRKTPVEYPADAIIKFDDGVTVPYSVGDNILFSRSGYNEDMDKQAKDYFGTTNNVNEAGYILKDGEFLDFSGKKQGARGGYRTLDHRDIKDAFDVQDDGADESLVNFVNNGNIRFMPEENAFFMANSPTTEQLKQIRKISDKADGEIELELYHDANDWNDRDKVFYRKYDKGTDFKVIKRDIDGFFGGGVSKANRFYSREDGFDYAKGSYYNKVASLYKGQSPDTLVHELSHDFFKSYFKLTEKYGLQDRNKAIYDMLGKKSSKEFGTAEWETLTEEFMKYMKTSESPNLASRNLFERAKDWLIKTFYTMNQDEEPSPEVKEFFDNLISSDMRGMDLTDLQMTPRSLKDVFKSIKEGNEVGLKGVRRKDLLAIQRAMLASTPRRGKTLAEEMRKDDMRIKADSELAKQFGYDTKKTLAEQPIFGKDGIDSMDSLDEYLVEKGMLEPNRAETYEQNADRESQIMSIMDQADSIYTPEQQKLADRRNAVEQNALKASQLASEIIKDNDLGIKTLEEFNKYLDEAVRLARSVDAILVNKNALEFLFDGYENAQKENAKLQKELRNAQDIIGVRQQLTDYIRKLPLNAQHRLSLLDKVKQVQKGDDFTDVLSKINDSFRTMWEQETKTLLKNNIDLIVKSTKPKDRKHQKYNYEYNKLFEEFRKINSMNKADASNTLVDFMQKKLLDESEFTEADKVKNLLLSYKANGMKSSVALMKQLESALHELRNAAIEDRVSTLEAKAERKQKQISDMVDYVNSSKKAGVLNATVLKATNLYSNEAELFGKKWAEAHEMETVELEQNMKVKKIIDEQIKEGKEIYGVTGDYDYAKLLNEKSQRKFTLYGINGKAEGSVKDISLMDIMDIYLTIKNKHSREIYDFLYEQHDDEGNTLTHNIQDLLDNLSDADKKFADSLQRKVQSWREVENKVYVDLYGIDMPEHEEYWMRSSEKPEKELMDIKQFANVDMIPSFFKERSSFPFASPENVWVKFQKRVNDSVYMTNTFEKFKEQYDLIHNHKVANAVTAKYDSQRFTSLTNSLNDISLKGNSEIFDEAQNLISQGIGNWVVSQIAVNPAVFTKQLVSLTNYAENMNVGDFVKYEAEFLMNPVKAIQFMREFDKEFLDYRFSSGMQNEVLGKIMGDAERNLSKYGYTYQKYLDLITLPVRYGDVGAIYIGGYARAKQLLRDGYSLDEARKIFRFETQRSQQSGLKSSLAQFQKNRYAKILTAFKNTQLQYMRKMQDSYIQWRRGEISTKQASKIWGNYMFIQAIAYQVLTNVFGYLRDDDDDKEMDWFKDVVMQVTTAPIAGVPLLGEMVQDVIRDRHYDLGMAGLGDVNKFLRQAHSVRKKYEEDELDAKSVFKGIATLLQFVKPLPNNIINPILND